MFKHLVENSPISKFQWGFMPCRSTTLALSSLVHDWLQELDSKMRSGRYSSIYTKHLTVSPTVISYTSWQHSISVHIYSNGSTVTPICCCGVSGFPQGSVVGTLLFIEDVTSQISPSSWISFYADDIAVYSSIRSSADYTLLQADITAIVMSVEEEKTFEFQCW